MVDMVSMVRNIPLGILISACAWVGSLDAHASGSAGPGMSRVSARGEYTVGKALLFQELVCKRCAIPRRGFNRNRARDLKASLDTAFVGDKPGTPDDDHIKVLFTDAPEKSAANVAAVRTYLERRYRL